MFRLLGFLIVGLLAGLLARFLVPGRHPMGCLMTMILGLAGSFTGGFIASLIWGPEGDRYIYPTGIIGSTIGAIVVLLIYGYSQRRNQP
jgi:uncharacterized membrane protein YeaQ/YmgE (transglycosylase-associated protein family)